MTNKKPYLYYALANLNTLLYPLAYTTAQIPFKAILITPYKTTLTTSIKNLYITSQAWQHYLQQ